MIVYTASMLPVQVHFHRWKTGRLTLPVYQRGFVWSMRKQTTFIDTVRRGEPIPSVLMRELDDGSFSLEDGHQRTETIRRYIDGEISDGTGRLYDDLTLVEQDRMQRYNIPVVTYAGATDEEARKIFNNHQNGSSLTFGERLVTMQTSMPIVNYATEMMLTTGVGFYSDMTGIWGNYSQKENRGAHMAAAYAICAGIAFGSKYISRKIDDALDVGHRDFDSVMVTDRLRKIINLFKRVAQTNGEKGLSSGYKKKYWDIGNFTGYIIHSIELFENGSPMFDGISYDKFAQSWVDYIVDESNNPGRLSEILHRDISEARSWNVNRWSNGVRRLFDRQSFVSRPPEEYMDDDDQ